MDCGLMNSSLADNGGMNGMDLIKNKGEVIIYQTDDGHTHIDVRIEDESVWLTQAQLCELYQSSKSNVSEHIKHIFEEFELEKDSVVRKFRTTASYQPQAAAHHRGAAAGCQS